MENNLLCGFRLGAETPILVTMQQVSLLTRKTFIEKKKKGKQSTVNSRVYVYENLKKYLAFQKFKAIQSLNNKVATPLWHRKRSSGHTKKDYPFLQIEKEDTTFNKL